MKKKKSDQDYKEIRHNNPFFEELLKILKQFNCDKRAVRKIQKVLGGLTIYIPKEEMIDRAERDAKITEEYDGTNVRFLSRKYGLTEPRIHQILKGKKSIRKTSAVSEIF